jgi:ribonuclease HI
MDNNQPKKVTIYTRGVSSVSGAGGYGVVLICGAHRKEMSGGCAEASNNRMDILATVEGLRALNRTCKVTIINNNAYIVDAIAKDWVIRWQSHGWVNNEGKPTPHVDLWKELIDLCSRNQVSFVWQRFDPANKDYACVDRLAHKAAGEAGNSFPVAIAEMPLCNENHVIPEGMETALKENSEAKAQAQETPRSASLQCWACDGAGFIRKQRCSACKGSGQVNPSANDAYERYSREMPNAPPGKVYRDNRYGNRRWGG